MDRTSWKPKVFKATESVDYKAEEEGTSDGAKKGWLNRQHGQKLSDEEDLKKQIKPYNDNWTDDQFEDNEWKKDQLEQVRIKNGTHTKHDYSDPDSIVFNTEKDHYEHVCGHCGKVQGSHGSGSKATENVDYKASENWKEVADKFYKEELNKDKKSAGESKLKAGYAQCPHCSTQMNRLDWLQDHIKTSHPTKASEGQLMKIEKNGWEFSVIDNGYGGDYAGGTKDVGLLEVAIFEPEIDPILGSQKSEIKGWMTQEDVEDLKRTFETDPVMAYRRIGGEWKESWQKGGEAYFVEWGYDLDYDFAEIDDIDDAKQLAKDNGGNVYLDDKLVYSVIPSIKKDPTNDKSKFIVSNNLMGVESKSDKCSYCGKGRMKENPEQCSGCGDVFSSEAKANEDSEGQQRGLSDSDEEELIEQTLEEWETIHLPYMSVGQDVSYNAFKIFAQSRNLTQSEIDYLWINGANPKANEGMGEIDPTELKKIVTDNFDTRGSGMFMFCNHCNHMIENKFGVDIGSFMTDINTQRKVLSHMMDYHVKELMVKEGFDQGLYGHVDAKCKTCGIEFDSIPDMDDHYAMNSDHISNLDDLDSDIPNSD